MSDPRTAAQDISDALGDDVVYLQPAGEQRFDPVSIGAVVGLWILGAVADGIREGIKDAAAGGTKAVLPAVGAAIRRRLPARVRDAFSRDAGEPPRAEVGAIGDVDRAGLLATVAAATREALEAEGLPAAAAARVEKVVTASVGAQLG